MSSRAFVFLGLLFAIVVLFMSSEVTARDLAGETNGVVEDAKHGGGGYNNDRGYHGGGGYNHGGHGGGHYGGGGYPRRGHYGGGGHCYHGCCGYGGRCSRCCSYAGEAADAKP